MVCAVAGPLNLGHKLHDGARGSPMGQMLAQIDMAPKAQRQRIEPSVAEH